MDNREAIEKAVISWQQNLDQQAGQLNPEQADKFLDYVVDVTSLKSEMRVHRFTPKTMRIHKIGVGRRVAVPAEEARDPAVRAGISTDLVVLEPRDVMVPMNITKDFLQYNLEKEKVEDHIIKMMATELANNLEELYILGNRHGHAVNPGDLVGGVDDPDRHVRDTYMALNDGFFVRAYQDGHRLNFDNGEVGSRLIKLAKAQLPTKYKRRPNDLRLYLAMDLEDHMRHRFGERQTSTGDSMLFGSPRSLTIAGVQHIPVPLLDTTPPWVEHLTVGALGNDQALQMERIEDLVVHRANLGKVPTAPLTEGADYDVDLVNGVFTPLAGGVLDPGDVVKITYRSSPMAMLTITKNMILGIGKDITIERDYDIYSRTRGYAVHCKVATQFEETDAIVHIRNIRQPD